MPDVRLVTCAQLPAPDPDTPLLAAALRDAGCSVAVDDWRDRAVEWKDAPLTVLRSPWDYVDALDDFLEWASAVAACSSLWNPLEVVRWNTHKSYLLDLDAQGAPTVPTVVLLGGSAASLAAIGDAREWPVVVVKPAVGVGAHGAGRYDATDERGQAHLDALLGRGDALVQPFMSSIEQHGETSLIMIDGRAHHAVRKRPAAGDFRVQVNWGGTEAVTAPDDALVGLGERVHAALPAHTLYTRVDVVRDDDTWRIIEVEATEPSLWLDHAPPASTAAFAGAVMARLGG